MINIKEKEHTSDCPWHRDWHSCNCGVFDFDTIKGIYAPLQITTIEVKNAENKERAQQTMEKYIKLIAKKDTWFIEGTDVFDYYSTTENLKYVSVQDFKEAKKYGIIDVRGWRISESQESENVPVGEKYFDGETCNLDEFEILQIT